MKGRVTDARKAYLFGFCILLILADTHVIKQSIDIYCVFYKGDYYMKINKLILRNFRNYPNLTIDFSSKLNIFVGDNAQGKTNILEAIYIGSVGRSHRNNSDEEFIKWDETSAGIELYFSRQEVDNTLGFKFYKEKRKEIVLNDFFIKPKDVIGSLTTVLFSPEDLSLIKGMPALRRRFLDIEISQAVPAYYRHLLQYNRILNQRNNLLKKIREKKSNIDLLDSWDEQLINTAAIIVNKRREVLKKLAMLANLMHRKLSSSKENLTLSYCQTMADVNQVTTPLEWYSHIIKQSRPIDIARGSTSIGPHRDDITIQVNGKDLKSFGSQGQQRTGILALKLAELEFLKSETGEYPILLLDDVMSELDNQRREQLLAFIRDRIQTFITATDIAYFANMKIGQYYRVNKGTVTVIDSTSHLSSKMK